MTAIVSKHGEIIKTISAPAEVVGLNTPDGCIALPDPPNLNMYFSEGEWVDLPASPSPNHIFSYELKDWIDPRTLDEIKAQKWDEIKSERDRLEFGGFEFEGGVYDSDQVSQGRIVGAAMAGVDQVWTLKNNATVLLTAAQLQQLYQALQLHIAEVHARGRAARQAIYEADTKEKVGAVTL